MRKVVITISIDDELLQDLDDLAAAAGQSRSSIITDLIRERIDHINETIAEYEKEKEN